MALGPIEVVVLELHGNQFTNQMRPGIVDLVERGIVTLVDALYITKDEEGSVAYLELEQFVDDPEIGALSRLMSGRLDLLASQDATELAAELEPGASALALVFEHRWLIPVREAIVESGGVLLSDFHIPYDVVESVLIAGVDTGHRPSSRTRNTMPRRQGRPGLVGTVARTATIAGTPSTISGPVAHRQRAWTYASAGQHTPPPGSAREPTASEQPVPQSATRAVADPPPATDPIVAELERLVELMQRGLLTDDEFAALKARLRAR